MTPVTLALLACGRPEPIEYPAVLEPLERDNLAAWPSEPGDPYPEALTLTSGHDDVEDRFWAHGRGFVHADLATVWAAARTAEVNVDRREVDAWEITWDTVPEYDHSYTITNTVEDVVTVSYDTTWVHQAQGEPASPVEVVARWDKTDGTAFIDLLSGSLVLVPIYDDASGRDVTSVELQEHLRAALRDEQTLEAYLTDLYTELVAVAHGDPLPTYE